MLLCIWTNLHAYLGHLSHLGHHALKGIFRGLLKGPRTRTISSVPLFIDIKQNTFCLLTQNTVLGMWCHAVRATKTFQVQFTTKEIRLALTWHNRLYTLSVGDCEFEFWKRRQLSVAMIPREQKFLSFLWRRMALLSTLSVTTAVRNHCYLRAHVCRRW